MFFLLDVAPALAHDADMLSEISDGKFACQGVFLLTKQPGKKIWDEY
jgi:hypothetical protein